MALVDGQRIFELMKQTLKGKSMPNSTITYVTFHGHRPNWACRDAVAVEDSAARRAVQPNANPNQEFDRTVNLGFFKMKLRRETVTQAALLAQLPRLRDWGTSVVGNFVVFGPPPAQRGQFQPGTVRTAQSTSMNSIQSTQTDNVPPIASELPNEISFFGQHSVSNDVGLTGVLDTPGYRPESD